MKKQINENLDELLDQIKPEMTELSDDDKAWLNTEVGYELIDETPQKPD